MKTRERGFVGVVGESGQSAAYNDPLRETSGKLHSARRRDPARSSCSLRRVERRAKNVAFWPRKGKASFVIEAHRASCKTAEFQRRYAIRRAAQTYIYIQHLPSWMESRYLAGVLSSARELCASNSALLAKQVDNVSREIVISHHITRGKIYPVRACISLHRESFP